MNRVRTPILLCMVHNRALLVRALTATAVIASTVLLGVPDTATAALNEGSVSGTVQNDMGQPLQDICVNVENKWYGSTDSGGNYSVSNIPVGSYQIQFTDCTGTRSYARQWYEGASDQNNAQYVAVTNGQNTQLNTVTMHAGVSVSGRVTDSASNPIQNVHVNVDPTGNGSSGWAQTDSNGDYQTEALADGDYTVQFSDNQNPARYAREYYDNQDSRDNATQIQLDAATDTSYSGVDAQLADGVTIGGTVRDTSGNGIEDICVGVQLNAPNGEGIGWAQTQGDGTYEIGGLPQGDVYVSFNDNCSSSRRYLDEWYQDQRESDDATPLQVVAGSTYPSVDATLDEGASVSGTVTDENDQPLSNVSVSLDGDNDGNHGWARTDGSGNYTAIVAPDSYKVRFEDQSGSHAIEYWNNRPSRDRADLLNVPDVSPITDVDAQLEPGAHVSGTVTDPQGAPAANICVNALYDTGDDLSRVADSQTDAAGNYTFNTLPAGSYRVYFRDCNNSGPYLDQFYSGSAGLDGAATIELSIGLSRTGVNAQMQPAAQIQGTVTDAGGTPLRDICVQATTDDFVGGMEDTDGAGDYSIKLSRAGQYKVQFVDCGDPEDNPPRPGGKYLAQWWGGGLEPDTAERVGVAEGATVEGIDASLIAAGGTGTVSGRVTDVRGEALETCVVLYLPTDSVRFAATDDEGNYSFTGVPTGTWTIGFVGCGPDGPSPVVPGAAGTGVSFGARWYGGMPLTLGEDSPDPIAQGATLVTIGPDESIAADMCFGCGSVEVKPPVVGEDHILVDFETTGLVPGDPQNASAQAALTYNVKCDSDSGTSTSASQDTYPVKVSGFTPGAPYVCSARILSNGVEVADSTTFEVTVGKATPTVPEGTDPDTKPATPAAPSAPSAPTQPDEVFRGPAGDTAAPGSGTPSGSPAKLAFTGGAGAALLALGAFMILLGLGVVLATRRTTQDMRRRATS